MPMRVFVCSGTEDYVQWPHDDAGQVNYGQQFGLCTSGTGSWIDLETLLPGGSTGGSTGGSAGTAFDPSTLDASELAKAYGAGWVVMGTGLAIAWAAAEVFRAIRGTFDN